MDIPFKKPEKFSIKKCREILKSDSEKFTDEEIVKIRDFFFELAEIDYKNFIKIRSRKENEKSNTIH